jgi:hypothetical protein
MDDPNGGGRGPSDRLGFIAASAEACPVQFKLRRGNLRRRYLRLGALALEMKNAPAGNRWGISFDSWCVWTLGGLGAHSSARNYHSYGS